MLTKEDKNAGFSDEPFDDSNLLERHHDVRNSCDCEMLKIFSILGKRHTMPILRILLQKNVLRFNELLQFVGGSPRTLSLRLKELEKQGFLIRTVYNEIPMRVEYELTERGKDLRPMFDFISKWTQKYFN